MRTKHMQVAIQAMMKWPEENYALVFILSPDNQVRSN
ncbi:hypothetical protein predicted by Glimmer/Critica [Salmonella enterica subsp. enterica serovar Weltevreden str. 2007-60-3289-1]|nr:hypothetical protein predicted by Glimmer/Critica [Salmonella enterica subsp. enterica serovar Weltevreden str. 2007-60-3289-1]